MQQGDDLLCRIASPRFPSFGTSEMHSKCLKCMIHRNFYYAIYRRFWALSKSYIESGFCKINSSLLVCFLLSPMIYHPNPFVLPPHLLLLIRMLHHWSSPRLLLPSTFWMFFLVIIDLVAILKINYGLAGLAAYHCWLNRFLLLISPLFCPHHCSP